MKTAKYISAMLLAVIMGFINIYGQKVIRSESPDTRGSSTVKKEQIRQTTSQRSSAIQAERLVQKQQPTGQRTTSPVNRTANVQDGRQRSVQRQVATSERPASISTNHNPRSDYRRADSKVYVKPNKYSEKNYYGGHHYHPVYPTRKVRVNYHHDTYLHNYHVLYYPVYSDIFWTRSMYHDYRRWYPNYRWKYEYGYRIQTISVFDAKYNLGEVAMIYGRVYATWHNQETDDYLLFFGGDYPYQQFTAVLPGYIARKFSWRPERFFLGEHVTMTGLITTFEGNPEIIIKDKRQLGIY